MKFFAYHQSRLDLVGLVDLLEVILMIEEFVRRFLAHLFDPSIRVNL
jgi:hypothetical protein